MKTYNCHYPSLNPAGQIVASQTVLNSLGSEKSILLGDFNAAWNSQPITMFTEAGFNNSNLLSQSFPDHILSNLIVSNYSVNTTNHSDHPIVSATINKPVVYLPAILGLLIE